MKQEFVTLPREVVEQALAAMSLALSDVDWRKGSPTQPVIHKAYNATSAALEQPQANQPAMTPIAQRKLEDLVASGYTISGYSIYHEQKHQHGFVTGAGLVGWWKPGGMEYPQPQGELKPVSGVVIDGSMGVPALVKLGSEDAHIQKFGGQRLYTHQPPALEQPQGEQEPVAWQYRMRPDWGIKKDCWGPWQDCTREQAAMYQRVQPLHDWVYESRQLYTNPQPKREPLTDKQISRLWSDAHNDTTDRMAFQVLARAIEAAHNIK